MQPRSFDDAQRIADRFKRSHPVILDLQTTEGELADRLIDFASGITYGLGGGMEEIGEMTFLLTPRDFAISPEDRARLFEQGFVIQS